MQHNSQAVAWRGRVGVWKQVRAGAGCCCLVRRVEGVVGVSSNAMLCHAVLYHAMLWLAAEVTWSR